MTAMRDIPCVKGFMRVCADGMAMGWHERNGGNLTYRMTDEDIAACRPYFCDAPGAWMPLGVQARDLAGAYFIATGSGRFMRNVHDAPEDNLCVCHISPEGDAYRLVWGLEQGGLPTSEFPSHFLNHAVRARATGGRSRVIYHAHPVHIIALTFVLPLTARAFTRALWQAMTECPIIFPRGVGVLRWMVPGGAQIALETSRLMEEYDAVVWAHHGLFAAGATFDETFGLMHTIEKAADITLHVIQSGRPVLQTIPDAGLREAARAFGERINEDFLADE